MLLFFFSFQYYTYVVIIKNKGMFCSNFELIDKGTAGLIIHSSTSFHDKDKRLLVNYKSTKKSRIKISNKNNNNTHD